MTDHSVRARSEKVRQPVFGGKMFVVLSIGIVLCFSAVHGTFKAKKSVESASWDGISSFTLAIDGAEDYLAILQKDPKRLAIFNMGDMGGEGATQDEILKSVSRAGEVVVGNYIRSRGDGDLLDSFEKFTSYTTPVKILFGAWDSESTNVTRIDAIKLWWQAKDIRSDDVSDVNIGEIDSGSGSSVLGVDTNEINRLVAPYVENLEILSEEKEINIVNASDDTRAARLVERFISTFGGRVIAINGSVSLVEKCSVVGDKSYTREYLANTFDCDIKDNVFGDPTDIVTIVIGESFSKTYF